MQRCRFVERLGSELHPIAALQSNADIFFVPVASSSCSVRCGAVSEAHAKRQHCNQTLPFVRARGSELAPGPLRGRGQSTGQMAALQSNATILSQPQFRAHDRPVAGRRASRTPNGSAAIECCHFVVATFRSSCSARCGAESEMHAKWQRCN